MQADWEDAPEHLRAKRPGPWLLIAIASTGTLLTFGALALMDFGIIVDINKLKDAFEIHTASTSPAPLREEPPAIAVESQTSAPIPIASHPSFQATRLPAATERNAQGKQIVFNDHNYIPKPAANTFRPLNTESITETRRAQPRPAELVTRSAHWEWENGYEKKRVGGRFEWIEADGEIDLSSVCQNYRRGSLIYRDCRKGAKSTLKNMCNSYEPACKAAQNITP